MNLSNHKKYTKPDCYWCDYLACIIKGNKRTKGKKKTSKCPVKNRPKTRDFRHKIKSEAIDE